jgi:hypothetical protein
MNEKSLAAAAGLADWRVSWKKLVSKETFRLLLPKEHGSWSLALEPIALGLLVAPSRAGAPLALAAVAGFFLRRPLKILLQTKPDSRRANAAFSAGILSFAAVAGLLLAVELGGIIRLWPLLPAAVAGLFFVWLDVRGENREGAAELAGASAFALLPAAFAALAGWPVASSLALAAVMLARSVPTVMTVRAFFRRRKGQIISLAPPLLAALLATGILCGLARLGLMPWAVAIFSIAFAARTIWFCSAPPQRLSARRLGFGELFLGVALILIAAVSWSN